VTSFHEVGDIVQLVANAGSGEGDGDGFSPFVGSNPGARGFTVLTATDVGFAAFGAAVDFGFDVAGLTVNGAGSSSAGGSATTNLPKPSIDACGGIRQLQPISVAASMPMRSILIRFPSRHGIHFEPVLVDLVTPISGASLIVQRRPHSLDVGILTRQGFRSYKARTHGLIALCDIDASQVVFDSSAGKRIKRVVNAPAHSPATARGRIP